MKSTLHIEVGQTGPDLLCTQSDIQSHFCRCCDDLTSCTVSSCFIFFVDPMMENKLPYTLLWSGRIWVTNDLYSLKREYWMFSVSITMRMISTETPSSCLLWGLSDLQQVNIRLFTQQLHSLIGYTRDMLTGEAYWLGGGTDPFIAV